MLKIDIVDGKVQYTNPTPDNMSEDTTGTDKIGKDAFLQLLVAQLKYQDPLGPSTNQDFLGELAQFTTVEELQNLASSMSSAMSHSSALSLVGKNVIIEDGLSSGSEDTKQVGGYVEFVQIIEGKTYVSVNGNLYLSDDVTAVIDDAYLDSVINGGDSSDNKTDSQAPSENDSNPDVTE